jgi:hypothetical protein
MTSFRKIATAATCVAVICGAALFWWLHKEQATQRKLAEDARLSRVRAEQGDPKAQFDLGKMYSQGLGVPQDYAQAARWNRKAADQGDAHAQYGLGLGYNRGEGVSQNSAEAVRWYRKAADQGYVNAQDALGSMYRFGQGVPQDDTEAARWYRKAADQGDESAQILIGYMYYHGQGVSRNYPEAVRWFGRGVGKVAAACLARTQARPLQRWTAMVAILLALPIVVVPLRLWGRATWMPSALCSACCAAALAHTLLSPSDLALLARVLPATIFGGLGRVLWLSLFAGSSAAFAIAAVGEVVRASKRDGEQAANDLKSK